jgi:hypothetical protein
VVGDTVGPVVGATVGPLAADTEGALSDVLAPTAGTTDAVVGTLHPVVGTVDPVVGATDPPPGTLEELASAGEADGGPLWTLPFEGLTGMTPGPEEVIILSLLAAAGATAVKVRFFLANTPPIPLACVVGDVGRYMSAVTSGATSLNTGTRVATEKAVAAGGKAKAAAESAVEKAESKVEELFHPVRDGFLRGAGYLDVEDDEASDVRLLMQLGIVLGTIYLAFLTVWFWATRLRWNPRN